MMSSNYIHHMKTLIDEGKVSEEQIDRAVLRILRLKDKLGLFENPFRSVSVEEEAKYNLCAEHRDIARRAAEQAAVLLKNDGVLPLSENIKRLAVIGPFAACGMNGWWSCQGKTEESTSVVDGLRAALPQAQITCVAGCTDGLHDKMDAAMLAEALAAAREAEAVVLCLGEQEAWSGEGNSRADVGLPAVQKELLRRVAAENPNTAVLLFNGRPLALGDVIDDAPAFFTMWQPGTEGGSAAANLLLGRVNFAGHLTMTFPYHVGQAPIYYNSMRTGRPKPGDQSTVGYVSRYVDMPNAPLFPFGYGLSYTTFAYGTPTLSANTLKKGSGEQVTVSMTVKNTGKVAGTTVVQLYIRDLVASLVRPVRELRGYERITLAAGEEKTVTFTVDEPMLAFRTECGRVEAELGDFHLWAAADSASGEPLKLKLV
jgi:beta-glucosidase